MPDPIVSLTDLKAHLGFTDDQDEDDALIEAKGIAAQSFIERQLGFGLRERFEAVHEIPDDLREAILQLATWWFENREAVADRGARLPYGVQDIIDAHRDWSF